MDKSNPQNQEVSKDFGNGGPRQFSRSDQKNLVKWGKLQTVWKTHFEHPILGHSS